MKYVKYAAVLFIAAVLLHFARSNSQEKPRHISHIENGVNFDFYTIPKAIEATDVRIKITITGKIDSLWRPVLRYSKYGFDKSTGLYSYKTKPLILEDSTTGSYFTDISSGGKNSRKYFFFEIRDNVGRLQARVLEDSGKPFGINVVGQVPLLLLIVHIFLLSAGTFFCVLGANYALNLIRNGTDLRPMARSFIWAAISFFVAAYPIGMKMNRYAFGFSWGGVPFGTVIADNKLQLLFALMLFVGASMLGSLRQTGWGRDIFPARTIAWLAIATVPIMLAIYLVPNYMHMEPVLVQVSCYSFLGLLVILYIVGLVSSHRQVETEKPRKMRKRTRKSG